jgi:hypothetical protein
MAIFDVGTKAAENDELLRQRIADHFPTNHYEIGRGQWLVSFPGTSQELYTKLFPEPELPLPSKNVIVVGFAGYYGIGSRDMWEWIATKLGGKPA